MPNPRRSGGRLVRSLPSKEIVPESGRSRPAIIRRVVVLPQPDGPSNPKNSPCATSRETSATARVDPKLREIFFSERKATIYYDHVSQCPSILTNHSHFCARGPNLPAVP